MFKIYLEKKISSPIVLCVFGSLRERIKTLNVRQAGGLISRKGAKRGTEDYALESAPRLFHDGILKNRGVA